MLSFDCDTQKLINRFEQSRRIHPLKLDLPIADIINKEREWLAPLKKISDYYLDTTEFTINLLRKKIRVLFNKNIKTKAMVRVIHLDIKMDYLRNDIVFDMRFLKTPFI